MKKEQETLWLNGWFFLLNGIAGLMNMTTILAFSMPTTHFTGHLSRVGMELAQNDWSQFASVLAGIGCFVFGSGLSGYLFADRVFHLKRRYGMVLMLLGVGHLLLSQLHNQWLIVCYCAFSAGIQNGLFIFYRGALVRTTHFTGYLTDIGFELGRVLRGQYDALWKVRFYFVSIVCFIAGGAAAILIDTQSLAIIGWGYLLAGSYYFLFRKYFYNQA